MSGSGAEAQGSPYLDALPTETMELHPVIALARTRIVAAAGELRSVEDGALEGAWQWRGEPNDVRYGFYDAYEQLEVARGAVGDALAQAGTVPAAGARRAARATAARWDLHARLLALSDRDLDRDPGGGEWTIRQTLAHIVNAQRAYGHYTAGGSSSATSIRSPTRSQRRWMTASRTRPSKAPGRSPTSVPGSTTCWISSCRAWPVWMKASWRLEPSGRACGSIAASAWDGGRRT